MKELMAYLEGQGVSEAYLFGSRARQNHDQESDWDLGVRFREPLEGLAAHSRLARLEVELRALLGAPVDLVDLKEAHLTLLYEILWRGRCLFCDNDEARVQRELQVRRRFEDYRQIQNFYTQALKERLNNAS